MLLRLPPSGSAGDKLKQESLTHISYYISSLFVGSSEIRGRYQDWDTFLQMPFQAWGFGGWVSDIADVYLVFPAVAKQKKKVAGGIRAEIITY